MKNKKLFNAIVKISLFSTILAMSFQVLPANAAGLTLMSDTLSRLQVNTFADHTIAFTLGAATDWDAGDTLTVTFPAGFDLTALTTATTEDFDIKTAAADETIVAAGSCAATDSIELTSIVGQVITFTACASYTAPGVGSAVEIQIGLNATFGAAGDSQIKNPVAAGNDLKLSVAGTIGDTGSLALSIVTSDRVTITATIDPTFTFTISSTSCALGTLTTLAVGTCNYTLAVGTNATDGASITIEAVDAGDGQKDMHNAATLTDDINDVGEATVTAGTEGYGIALTAGAGWTEDGNFATDDSSVPTSLTTFLTRTTPVLISVTNTVTHRAAIDATTVAGSYVQTVQYIATGNF